MKKRTKRIALLLAAAILFTSVSVLFTGCRTNSDENGTEITDRDLSTEEGYDTPDDVTPATFTSEEELPEDNFYVVHTKNEKDKKGKSHEVTYYYQIYASDHSFDGSNTQAAGADPTRITWLNYNVDEGMVPTLYPGDKLIYKSSTSIPTLYYWEKFFDDGYSVGVAGLKQDISGNYKYSTSDNSTTRTMPTSDATGFDALDADSIYLVSVGDERITPKNVSDAGFVKGLKLMHAYTCDIRTGTEKISATLTANIHCFSSAENYITSKFDFITDHIAEIDIPDYLTTGYYYMNGLGMFRYLKTEESVDDLTESDYNQTIYKYDDVYNTPEGSKDGYVLDENGILVQSDASSLLDDENEGDPDYDNHAYNEDESVVTTSKTSDPVDTNGYSSGKFTIKSVGDPVTYASGQYYTITATKEGNSKDFIARLYIENSSSITVPEVDSKYIITYAKSTRSDYKDYEIFTIDKTE